MKSIEAQIKQRSYITSDEVVYLIKGFMRVAAKDIKLTDGATRAEAILELLKDGWTAMPF